MTDNDTIHVAFQAIWQFEDHYKCSPKPWDKNDSEIFAAIANDTNRKLNKPFENLNQDLLRLFSAVSAGSVSPVVSVIGGVCAQEIMKACSGKFHPICQYFYFDCREALPTNRPFDVLTTESCTLDDSDSPLLKRYQAQIAVFGKAFQEKLLGSKFFIVGSGALGCEYLKNFAMIGIGCGTHGGHITLTDMDTIEKSNLNRQFLFRSNDVGKSKALVASNAVRRMNPQLTIEPHLNRIAVETENVYNDGFFESLDGVCNALDNVAARNYVDSRCVYYRKPLIESGTLGTQGNVQCILPFLTESYSSTQDPPGMALSIIASNCS
jgi:ubiquitin-activating enzyme E1